MISIVSNRSARWKRWLLIGFIGALAAIGVAVAFLMKAPPIPADAGTVPRVRLMTNQQYTNTIHNIFGADIRVGTVMPPMQRTDGLLALGASSVGFPSGRVQDFRRAAMEIAEQIMEDPSRREYLVPCQPASAVAPDDACAEEFLRSTGRLLFRRPLTDVEVEHFVDQAHKTAASLKDFYAGLQLVLEGMLINPRVLLIQDTTEPDPDRPGSLRLDSYALASRLSLFLWNSVPDDELLDAAESGQLHTSKGRKREVERMLSSPRVEQGVRAFFADMFQFYQFDVLTKDPIVYPAVTAATLDDAREQTLRTIVDHVLHDDGDYRDLFTTRSTFISPALSPIYQAPALPGWSAYEFPANGTRAGIITHMSFLALHAHPTRSSPTLRGQALRELFLCQEVPPPPPNVDFSAVEDPDASLRTARERLKVHRSNPSCAGCHKITDPIGLALEKFDGAGRFRESENGAPIDVSGNLDGKEFSTVAELGEAFHDHPAVPSCLVRRVYSYATGGPLKSRRNEFVSILEQRFAKSGYSIVNLFREIATSDVFSRIAATAQPIEESPNDRSSQDRLMTAAD